MKILILEDIADTAYGGAEKSMFDFIQYASANDNEVFIACKHINYSNKNLLQKRIRINSEAFQLIKLHLFIFDVVKMVRFINQNNIELVFTHTIHNFPLLRIVKYLTKVKTSVIFKWIYNNKDIGYKAKWGLKTIDKVVFLNEYLASYWRPFFIEQHHQFIYIPDGVNLKIREPVIVDVFQNLLFVGRITEGKGIHILLNAFNEIDQITQLTVVGEFNPERDPFHKSIWKFVELNNLQSRINFIGTVRNEEIKSFYDKADLLIVPSILPEAQPLVIIEAVMRGIPIICSKIGGMEFMISKSDFWFFEPNNENSIVNKINDLNQIHKKIMEDEFEVLREEIFSKYNILNTQVKLLNFLNN